MTIWNIHGLIGETGEAITWWQMSLRGALIFLIGLLFFRLAERRLFGKWGALDTVVAVIIGSNLSRAMTGNASFWPAICATAVLLMLHAVLVYAAVFVPAISPWVKGMPVLLVRSGVADTKTMRRHGIGDGDLVEALRCHGVEDITTVRSATLERNGSISVICDDR